MTIYKFDRYINGQLMAEDVTIEKAKTLDAATAAAARIASKGPKGEAPVLVLRREPAAIEAPVQEAARVPEIAALIEAAKALHRDMLERAQLKIDTISGEQYRIVNSGRTAWADFDAALRAIAEGRG